MLSIFCFAAVLCVAVERFSADADIVKDMVCTSKMSEKNKRGGG